MSDNTKWSNGPWQESARLKLKAEEDLLVESLRDDLREAKQRIEELETLVGDLKSAMIDVRAAVRPIAQTTQSLLDSLEEIDCYIKLDKGGEEALK